MSETCPPIPNFADDPFKYYARYLIDAFKKEYGTEKFSASVSGENVFEDGTSFQNPSTRLFECSWHNVNKNYIYRAPDGGSFLDHVDPKIGQFLGPSVDRLDSFVIEKNLTGWDAALPYYIKGPKWDKFDSYSTKAWHVYDEENRDGWFDLAGALVVHPMLRMQETFYNGDNDRGLSESSWNYPWLGDKSEIADLTVGTFVGAGSEAITETLKFGFLLELLDAFLYIDENPPDGFEPGEFLKPDMDPFTWCQAFWAGYERNDLILSEPRRDLGAGTGGGIEGPAWNGDLNPPGRTACEVIYKPRKGQLGTRSESVSVEGDEETLYFFDDSRRRDPGGLHVGIQNYQGALGHSVKIKDADYNAFVFWLYKALDILDQFNIGVLSQGPGVDPGFALSEPDDLLSSIFLASGSQKLARSRGAEKGPPYGSLQRIDPYENNFRVDVFRKMADNLYFNTSSGLPLSDTLTDEVLEFWNSFLHEHSVSVSLSTEALNEAIAASGVDRECDAVVIDASTPSLGFKGVDPGQCRVEIDLTEQLEVEVTCVPDPNAIVPNWLNQPEGEPFFNNKLCEYSVVVLADPPDCSQEYLDSFIPDAVNQLLDYYGKDVSTKFVDLGDRTEETLNSRDVLVNGSGGLFRENLIFSGTAKVSNFYIPPRPLAKTKILVTVQAEEFNRIPARPVKVEEASPLPTYVNGEPSFVVFLASEMKSIFDKVGQAFDVYKRLYADWHLETGKIIKGLNFETDSKRLASFFKETDLFIKDSGYSLSGLEWVEIGFSPEYKIEYIKVQEEGAPPVQLEKGFSVYANKSPMIDRTTASYVSQLPNMRDDLMVREAMSWYNVTKKYRFPVIEETYLLDPTSPTTEGNEGLKNVEQFVCPEGSSSKAFEPGSSFSKSLVTDIQGALLSQFSSNPCALVDAKILEQQGRVDFAMQITDMTIKEYLTSDRFINDLPELLVRGRFDDIQSLYAGMLNNLGTCGLIDLIKSAVDCILNSLGYDDSITIIVGAAIKGMDEESLRKLVVSLSPESQNVVVAAIREVAPQLLPLVAGLVEVTILDDGGAIVEPVRDRTVSYTSYDAPLGSLGSPGFVGVTRTPGSVTTELSLSSPPGTIGSLGAENRAATVDEYGQLKDVVYDLLINDVLNVDEIMNILNNLPGAGIAINIIQKIDKFCIAPPLVYPPLNEFIKLPGVNIDFCELQGSITIPVLPKIRFNSINKILIDNALRVLEELLIRLLILILKKVLQIIAEELCKTRLGPDPLDLRGALKDGLCGDSDIDPGLVDAALTDLIGALGCLSDPEVVGRLIDNVAAVVTQCELLDLINGEGSDGLYNLVVEIVNNDPSTASLAECLYDRDSVHNFFKSVGVFIDLEQLCIDDATNLPVSREVCDNMGLLQVFRSVRADALRQKGVDEACIEDQLCVLRDQTVADLEDLMSLLQAGVFSNIIPNIMKDVTSNDPSLLPAEMPSVTIATDEIFNSIFDAMSISFTEDIMGKRGFINMVLADSRGRGFQQHLNFQKSLLGPAVLNIYGSRGTRAQPPRNEWGEGYDSGNTEEWNGWITEKRKYTDGRIWRLPYLFNPVSSRDPDNTESNKGDGDRSEGEGLITTGQAPAMGGLPDKIAGHLQESLDTLNVSFDTSSPFYTTNFVWTDYDKPDALQFVFSYDYWVDPPEDVDKHAWDGHRLLINMTNESWKDEEGDTYQEEVARYKISSFVDESVSQYKSQFLSDYYVDRSSSPLSSFLALLEEKTYTTLGSPDTPAGIDAGTNQFRSTYTNEIVREGMTTLFEAINKSILETIAKLVAGSGDTSSPFEYGFNNGKPPKVVYFHDPGEEYEGDIPAAVARYGGSENNPPFYIEPPESSGFLKIAEGIIPNFTPCTDNTEVVTFPEFNSLSSLCSEFTSQINEDPRAGLKVKGVSAQKEVPFDRHLSRASLGVIEGTIYATIRAYITEVLLKALPAVKFMAIADHNYGDMLAEFIIDKMETGMIEVGRGKRFVEMYKDYWWLFLEQVVQNFAIKVKAGIITDQTTDEMDALEYIQQYVTDNWEYVAPDAVVGLLSARRIAKQRKENWDKIFEDSAPGVQSPLITKCKIILRRYIKEEYDRTSEIFSNYVKPSYNDINDIIIQSPLILRGAISDDSADPSADFSENGPFDVPDLGYYISKREGLKPEHPYNLKAPPITSSRVPFVLERYIVSKGSTDTANNLKSAGFISNILDAEAIAGGESIQAEDDVYFGLRIMFLPEALKTPEAIDLYNDFDGAMGSIPEEVGFTYKAFTDTYGMAIPMAVAEKQIVTDSFSADLYNSSLQDLVCLLVETPEYKMLFEHCFPVPKYMDLIALYCANTFVPSLARVSDGWAAKTNVFGGPAQPRGGGRWIGFGKSGGMNTWRGDEGMKNSFLNTKRTARQTLEAACYTSYDYKDKDYMSPSEVYVDNMGLNQDVDPGLKWWQWSSLRPPPCKKKED